MRIQTKSFVPVSELGISSHLMENMADGAPFSWGDAEHTLVHPERLSEWMMHCVDEDTFYDPSFTDIIKVLDAFDDDIFIDMEN
jgi:hypothetical protein